MKRIRWTILDVEESVIALVKKYAKKHGFTIAGALKDLIEKGLKKS